MRIQLMFIVPVTVWAPALAAGQEFAGRDKLRRPLPGVQARAAALAAGAA